MSMTLLMKPFVMLGGGGSRPIVRCVVPAGTLRTDWLGAADVDRVIVRCVVPAGTLRTHWLGAADVDRVIVRCVVPAGTLRTHWRTNTAQLGFPVAHCPT